jgi:hypothetical protein
MRKYLEHGAVKALSVSREQSECHRPTSMRLRLLAASLIEDDPDSVDETSGRHEERRQQGTT